MESRKNKPPSATAEQRKKTRKDAVYVFCHGCQQSFRSYSNNKLIALTRHMVYCGRNIANSSPSQQLLDTNDIDSNVGNNDSYSYEDIPLNSIEPSNRGDMFFRPENALNDSADPIQKKDKNSSDSEMSDESVPNLFMRRTTRSLGKTIQGMH